MSADGATGQALVEGQDPVHSPQHVALTPGIRLGVYEVTAQIDEGGMGRVWRGTDTTLGRQVAITLKPSKPRTSRGTSIAI